MRLLLCLPLLLCPSLSPAALTRQEQRQLERGVFKVLRIHPENEEGLALLHSIYEKAYERNVSPEPWLARL